MQQAYDWATQIQRCALYSPPNLPMIFVTPRNVSKGTATVINEYVRVEQLALKMIHDTVPNNDFYGTISQLVAEYALDREWILITAYPNLQPSASLYNYVARTAGQFPKGDYRRFDPAPVVQEKTALMSMSEIVAYTTRLRQAMNTSTDEVD